MVPQSNPEPSPPPRLPSQYKPPRGGIFTILPTSWVPYAELMRLDRPAGYYAFYWHYIIGLSFAACIAVPPPTLTNLAILAAYLGFWVLILRGAVCTWNDNLDQSFDRKVARTRFRPIARGAVSTVQANLFTLLQLIVGAIILIPLPAECSIYAGIITIILVIYPLGKRFTDFPQAILGLGFALPIFLCCAIFEIDPLLQNNAGSDAETRSAHLTAAVFLYFAGALWTMIFDTIYAHQDINDDKKVGIRSLSVFLGGRTKPVLSVLAAIQVALLVAMGVKCQFSTIYFMGSCTGAAVALFAMLRFVDLRNPTSCAWWFGSSRLVGGSIAAGLLFEYMLRLWLVEGGIRQQKIGFS